MQSVEVGLRQIERTDASVVKKLLSSPFSKLANLPTLGDFFNAHDRVCFAITASKGGSDVYVVGVCGLFNIDWISRHAELIFIMMDKLKYDGTIQNFSPTTSALTRLLKFGFEELGLNKVWLEILETNHSMETLESMGFVVEGIRRDAAFKGGQFVSSSVLSITAQEFGAK